MGGVGVGGPGGAVGGDTGGWSFGSPPYGGSDVGNFGGGQPVGVGVPPPVVTAFMGQGGQSVMGGEELHGLNEQMAQQSLIPEAQSQQMTVDALLGTNQGQSFGYGNSMPFPEAGLPQGGFLTNYLIPALNMVTSMAIPMSAPVKGLASGVFSGLQAALLGQDIPTAFGKGFMSGAIPFAGTILGQLPDRGTGDVAGMGTGIPGEMPEGGMAPQGMVTQGITPQQGPSPVAQAVAPAPMLSAQPFGWYSQGMKRVNMPWVSQPGSQQLRGNPSGNYGGMKRVG